MFPARCSGKIARRKDRNMMLVRFDGGDRSMSTLQARIAPLSGAEASTNGWATRVTLQPIAAPSALGLAGFSVATLMVATIQAKWWGSPADFKGVAPFCLTFGGIAQFLAGMWAYKARDIVATLAHGMWGAFWIAFF